MVAFSILKFWRETTITVSAGAPSPVIGEVEEEDDSFFDLELSVNDAGGEKQSNPVAGQEQQPTHDVFSKRKIIPIEPSPPSASPELQPPVSVIESSPKFRALKKINKTGEPERGRNRDTLSSPTGVKGSKPEKKLRSGKKLALSGASAIQKYLKRIKPMYVKSSKSKHQSMAPPASSPATAATCSNRFPKQGSAHSGFRGVCKNLGKSKSSSAAAGVESPARRDDSLIQQNDGIQSAILHCKRSFESSRESSMLSRSSVDSIRSSFSDCSVYSRYSNEKWIDSARNSSSEGCIVRMRLCVSNTQV